MQRQNNAAEQLCSHSQRQRASTHGCSTAHCPTNPGTLAAERRLAMMRRAFLGSIRGSCQVGGGNAGQAHLSFVHNQKAGRSLPVHGLYVQACKHTHFKRRVSLLNDRVNPTQEGHAHQARVWCGLPPALALAHVRRHQVGQVGHREALAAGGRSVHLCSAGAGGGGGGTRGGALGCRGVRAWKRWLLISVCSLQASRRCGGTTQPAHTSRAQRLNLKLHDR